MASSIEQYVGRSVCVITSDGRCIVGSLRGFDQTLNIILEESYERVYSSSAGVEQVVLGLYLIRGDNVVVIGELDQELDKNIDLADIHADPLPSIVRA